MVRFLLHTLFLLIAVALAFFWTSNPQLSYYNLQLMAGFVLFFFLNQIISRRRRQKINLTIDAVIFTVITLLLVISTGGLTSPLFFLIYFLMFGLALLLEPLISVSLTAVIVLFFLFTPTKEEPLGVNLRGEPLNELLQLFSLLLITPVALFFGKQYLRGLQDEEKIKILEKEEEIMEEEIGKNGLTEILDQTSYLLADVSHLTVSQKERLDKIRERATQLLQSGKKLKIPPVGF